MRQASQSMKGNGAERTRLGEHVPLNAAGVALAPMLPGVYLLYRGHRLIYLGFAAPGHSIRQCLGEHLRGERGACTAAATEFDYESSVSPSQLYRHYMAVYMDATGGLMPECNDRQEVHGWLSSTG